MVSLPAVTTGSVAATQASGEADGTTDAPVDGALDGPADVAGEPLEPPVPQAAATIAMRPTDRMEILRTGNTSGWSQGRARVYRRDPGLSRTCRSGAGRRLGAASTLTLGA